MNPTMPAIILRPLLKDCLSYNMHISGKYIDNFRQRVAIHHERNQDKPMISMEQYKASSTSSNLTEKRLYRYEWSDNKSIF